MTTRVEKKEIVPIARLYSDFHDKFGIPRQSGLVPDLRGVIVFEPDFRLEEAIRGIDAFSHLWLIWGFSENEGSNWSPTVRPPRLGGNTRMGVFATRSTFRPNGLALSSVRLLKVEKVPKYGHIIHVAGADLMSGTPIYDIKPYLTTTDCHPEANNGFVDENRSPLWAVSDPDNHLAQWSPLQRENLRAVLAQNPTPAYHQQSGRIYGLKYAGYDIKFQVTTEGIIIKDVTPLREKSNIFFDQ